MKLLIHSPKLQWLYHWSLGMDKQFHPTFYNGCNYLSMLGLKLNHVSKRGPRPQCLKSVNVQSPLIISFGTLTFIIGKLSIMLTLRPDWLRHWCAKHHLQFHPPYVMISTLSGSDPELKVITWPNWGKGQESGQRLLSPYRIIQAAYAQKVVGRNRALQPFIHHFHSELTFLMKFTLL